jgi:hypothetical protein
VIAELDLGAADAGDAGVADLGQAVGTDEGQLDAVPVLLVDRAV